MIEAGIEDGALVLIRQQPAAEPGEIVIALLEDETTLNRYYPVAIKGVEEWNWQPVIDCAKEYRCHEDFSTTKTGMGRDFCRKWTHERAAEHIPLQSCTAGYVPEDDWCFKLDYLH